MGAAWGVIFTALDDRFKAVVLLDGGFFEGAAGNGRSRLRAAPEGSGADDWRQVRLGFLGKDALFRMLGTPAADKKAVTFDTAHDVSEHWADLVREVVAWLVGTLGRSIDDSGPHYPPNGPPQEQIHVGRILSRLHLAQADCALMIQAEP